MGKNKKGDGEEVASGLKLTTYLRWRLDVMMRERKIKTASALQSRLQNVGMTMSRAQVARVISERPARINSDLLDALVEILECDINDLLSKEDVPKPRNIEPVEEGSAPVAKKEEPNARVASRNRTNKEYSPRVTQRLPEVDESKPKRPKVVSFPNPLDKE
jgi:DNA-binding Xre family transcriptional regulator